MKILIVEDEVNISEAINAYLVKNNFTTLIASDGLIAYEYFKTFKPDLVLVDLMIPKLDGVELIKRIRKTSLVYIIILTAKNMLEDKIQGLEIGADDYMTKPFSPRELMARINTMLRRLEKSSKPLYNSMSWNNNDLEIDFNLCECKKKGEIVALTKIEFKILSVLAKNPSRVYTRENILKYLPKNLEIYERTIDVHIKNLRSKIEDDRSNPKYILTIRGIGYRFFTEEQT